MFKRYINFYHPETPTGTGTVNPIGAPAGKDRTVTDIENFLNSDDETPEVIDLKPEKDKKDKHDKEVHDKPDEEQDDEDKEDGENKNDKEEDEDDELKEIEEDLEEPDEEKLELTTPVSGREILKKYPNLWKDFPYLRNAYYREQQYTELLPTIGDAKEAVKDAATLASFENDLMNGNAEVIFKGVKSADEESFYKLADNLMTSLYKVDKDVHTHICGNIIKQVVLAMAQEGRSQQNEALSNSAVILNQFMNWGSDYKPPTQLHKEKTKDSKEDEIAEREKNFQRKKLDSAVEDLNTRVNNSYKKTIDDHIDPKSSMSDYVKKAASRDAFEKLEKVMKADRRFNQLVDKLWEKHIKDDYSKDSLDIIKRAFHSKAKTVLPSLINEARITALRGIGKRIKDTKDNEVEDNEVETNTPVRRTQSSNRQRNEPPSSRNTVGRKPGESTADFLMRE